MNPNPVLEIQGVSFFNTARSCISHFEAHWVKKALSLIISFGTLFAYALHKFFIRRMTAEIEPLTQERHLAKNRLVVCVHGLNDNPSQFTKIVEEMRKENLSETDIFIPQVLQKGNAKLDEMVQPIFDEIAKWANTPGEKELVLVGISNGGRISRALKVKVANLPIKKLRFVSIVGACKGSSLANLANKIGLSRLMSKNISEEMPTTSKRNQQLNQDWEESLSRECEHTFIASPHDWQVPNYDSSLMEAPNARYAIISGHGHSSIVHAAAPIVAKIITAS